MIEVQASLRGGLRSLVGVTVLAAMLAAMPAAAGAAKKPGKLQTATATSFTTVDDQAVTATATCPKGTTVVGGGYTTGVDPPGSLSDIHIVTESRRAGKTAWIVGAFRIDGGAVGPSLPVTAEAYCRKNAGKISEASDTKAAATSTSFLGGAAGCPLGRAAVGGGFKVVPPSTTSLSFLLLESRPIGSVGWSTQGLGATPGPNSVTAYAYCRKGSTKVATRTVSAALPSTSGPIVTASTPKCPAKLFPFAGGFQGPPFFSGAPLPGVIESRRSGGAWTVSAVNFSANPGSISLHSVCS